MLNKNRMETMSPFQKVLITDMKSRQSEDKEKREGAGSSDDENGEGDEERDTNLAFGEATGSVARLRW